MKFVTQDYYEIIGVAPGASSEEVGRAFRLTKQSFRPDSMAIHSLYSAEETEAIGAKIDEAFRVLSEPEAARRYAKYHRSGRAGTNVPRDPDVFFDIVHDMDGRSAIEELAEHVGRSQHERSIALERRRPEPGPRARQPIKLTQRDPDVASISREVVAQAEVFIDSLEEVPETDPPRPERDDVAALDGAEPPPLIPSPAGPHLAPSRLPEGTAQPLARIDPSTRRLPGAEVRPAGRVPATRPESPSMQGAPPPARSSARMPATPSVASLPAPRPALPWQRPRTPSPEASPAAASLPGPARLEPPSPAPQAREPRPPAPEVHCSAIGVQDQGAAAPVLEEQPRRWQRETVRTRAVGALNVEPIPPEELESLEADCGGVTGEFLRQVRRTQQISLEDIADRTKIGIAMLRYIEDGEVERLPARVYLKGYLTQVCRLLRLPTPEIPERYLERQGR